MILITGATGFVGRVLVRQLSSIGYPLRALIRPSAKSPRLPKGVPVEVAVVSLADTRGLRAAMRDVETIFHLASAENQGSRGDLLQTDIQGTQNLVDAAADAGVDRIVYLSHLGAARASGYPAFKAKGIAEESIRAGKAPHTIIRSSLVYGPEDHFTNNVSRLVRSSVGIFPVPTGGRVVVQPVWVEDLVTCMIWALQNESTVNQVYEIGGNEFFTLQQVVEIIMDVTRRRRFLVPMSPITLRALTVFLEGVLPGFPISSFFLDYFAVNRTTAVDAMPRYFGLMPARFSYRLDYLKRKRWYERIRNAISERLSTQRSN
ncbi:MAG: NAD-dependent epimerase/dehydratase family protein [Anaerolineales bacterium]|jgi:NADH dehydrogenase|nr:NAD-dependent epimerase/dehydratase family protein [Chloroflexota bacterium]MBK6644874.1 NAD-dependent epimerase/dehydratase family protein [Anaerolineales bacterium]MCC6985238.1 NAD-dependent epimerase/dehydratase family protein [Anaerolineales bacterium]